MLDTTPGGLQEQGLFSEHTLELYSIWGANNTDSNDPGCLTIPSAQGGCQDSIRIMQSYWISFVRTLNPNTMRDPSLPEWAPYSVCTQNRMVFNNGNATMETVGAGVGEVTLASMSQSQRCRGMTGNLSKAIVANLKPGQTLGAFANGTMMAPALSCAAGGNGTLVQVTASSTKSRSPGDFSTVGIIFASMLLLLL